jgi:hypothetical protein
VRRTYICKRPHEQRRSKQVTAVEETQVQPTPHGHTMSRCTGNAATQRGRQTDGHTGQRWCSVSSSRNVVMSIVASDSSASFHERSACGGSGFRFAKSAKRRCSTQAVHTQMMRMARAVASRHAVGWLTAAADCGAEPARRRRAHAAHATRVVAQALALALHALCAEGKAIRRANVPAAPGCSGRTPDTRRPPASASTASPTRHSVTRGASAAVSSEGGGDGRRDTQAGRRQLQQRRGGMSRAEACQCRRHPCRLLRDVLNGENG